MTKQERGHFFFIRTVYREEVDAKTYFLSALPTARWSMRQLSSYIPLPPPSVHHLMILQLLIYSLEKLTWTVHSVRSCWGPISSHGFAGPLKCKTAASLTILCSSADSGWPSPNPDTCQEGSMAWTCPWKATKAGGSSPKSQSLKPDSTFFSSCIIVNRQSQEV